LSYLTGYSPDELIFNSPTHELFEEFLENESEQNPPAESRQDKVLNACVKMKEKAAKGNKGDGGREL